VRSPKRSRFRGWSAAAAVALVSIVLTACGGSSDDTESSSASAESTAGSNNVEMELLAFKPGELTVDAGTKVTWRQNDPGAHTVTSGTVEQGTAGVTQQPDDRFESGDLSSGETFEFTFSEPGTYPYFCRLHPATMRGEIQVR
jgi:plastocyanin